MTSNLRSAEAMREFFRPEFLNRIDEIVEFKPLTREQLGEIVELQLERLRARLAERGLGLELTDAAKEHLAEAGWDPTYGARPLKRALQRLVENPLALRLLEGEFAEGDTVRVDVADGELVFAKAPAAEPRGLASSLGAPVAPRQSSGHPGPPPAPSVQPRFAPAWADPCRICDVGRRAAAREPGRRTRPCRSPAGRRR